MLTFGTRRSLRDAPCDSELSRTPSDRSRSPAGRGSRSPRAVTDRGEREPRPAGDRERSLGVRLSSLSQGASRNDRLVPKVNMALEAWRSVRSRGDARVRPGVDGRDRAMGLRRHVPPAWSDPAEIAHHHRFDWRRLLRRTEPSMAMAPGATRTVFGYSEPRQAGCHRLRHRSEEHTSELQSLAYLVCRLLLEKKKKKKNQATRTRKYTDIQVGLATL